LTGAHITALPEFLSSGFQARVKKLKDSPFGARLREAFGGARNTTIAEKIGVTPSTITEYMSGQSYPDIPKLIKISELTKCSIDWLLSGQGEASFDPLQALGNGQRTALEMVAARRKMSPEELLREWVDEGIASRIRELTMHLNRLRPREYDELRALVEVVGREDQDEPQEVVTKAG
jgi:transcriptional regulator with XRE-family HTH domain